MSNDMPIKYSSIFNKVFSIKLHITLITGFAYSHKKTKVAFVAANK